MIELFIRLFRSVAGVSDAYEGIRNRWRAEELLRVSRCLR